MKKSLKYIFILLILSTTNACKKPVCAAYSSSMTEKQKRKQARRQKRTIEGKLNKAWNNKAKNQSPKAVKSKRKKSRMF